MDDLIELGRLLGGVDYAQGPGGNVSLKTATTLHVKASGRRLRALHEPGAIADVPLDLARRALAGDHEADRAVFALAPRPSLETYFHALGGAVVAHTHALGALLLACAVQPDTDALWVRYERPGLGLAKAVEAVLGDRREGVLVLESHGLLVYADDVAGAVERTQAFDQSMRARFGTLPDFPAQVAALAAPFEVPGGFAGALPARHVREPRYLCPDAVVYATVLRVPALDDVPLLAASALGTLRRPVVLVADDGARVHCARTLDELDQAREVALAHDWVEDALGASGKYLPDDEPARIVSMPSEQYRLELTRKAASC